METVRGRWFLGEFAKRNRNADSELILERIDRIEKLLHEPPAMSPAERVRIDLVEMAKAIARTRSEIAAIRPDGDAKGTLSEASEELGSIVQTTERATSDILAAAEQVQEIAWTLRERGADSAICDALDQRATDVYSACSFQDLTGQRIRKVVDVLQFLEDRIRAMIEIWGGAVPDEDGGSAAVAAPHVGEDRTVPHLEQRDIDRMMPSARPDAPPVENGHDAAAAAYERRADDWAHPAAAQVPGVVAGIAASGIATAKAARAVATAVPAEAAAAAKPVMAAEAVMTPAMAVVGATALALDPTPIATARRPELAPEPEPAPEPELTPEVDALPEAAQHPPPEPIHEPAPEIEADASSSEPRSDPAAVLKRILAIIRAPNEPPAGSIAAQDASATSVAAALPIEPVAAPELEGAATAAAVTILAPAVADVGAAGGSRPDVVVADVVAVEARPADAGAARPGEPAEARAPKAAIEDAADDILMPLPGPLTVDQAVDAMLKAPGRGDAAATHAPAGVAAPVEEAPAGEPPAVTAEPDARETEPGAAGLEPPFVIEVPEFTVATPAPVPPAELAPQPPLVAGAVAAPIADPGEPEPQAPAAGLHSAATAAAAILASAQPDEPPVEPVAEAPSRIVAAAPPVAAASEPSRPVAPPAAPTAELARPAPRHPALAAIAALSDEEKIALFS
jgi:hypothetical protein